MAWMPIFWSEVAVSCENAAQQAAQQALQQLEGAKPVFAFILVDIAWEMLLKSHPGAEIAAVQDILGKDVPHCRRIYIGTDHSRKRSGSPQLLNQHIVVIVFGEALDRSVTH